LLDALVQASFVTMAVLNKIGAENDLIDRAEKRGFLARAPSPEDGRATEVFLTNEGTKLVTRLYLEVKQELAPLMARLDTSEQRHLQELLRRMLDPQG
jgi:DNA-binding MarR family transcriptional regulator